MWCSLTRSSPVPYSVGSLKAPKNNEPRMGGHLYKLPVKSRRFFFGPFFILIWSWGFGWSGVNTDGLGDSGRELGFCCNMCSKGCKHGQERLGDIRSQ